MFLNDRETNAEPKARAAAGALGGVERIEESRKRLSTDADAVVLHRHGNALRRPREPYLNAASIADFANSVLRIGYQVQKNLNKLIRIADDMRESRFWMEIHGDIVAAQRVFVKLQRALDNIVNIHGLFLR